MKISNELLSIVLQEDVRDAHKYNDRTINYIISYECEEDGEAVYGDTKQSINIYELAYICKENALLEGFRINTKMKISLISSERNKIDYYYEIIENNKIICQSWKNDSEPAAIFKARQWILDNKGK